MDLTILNLYEKYSSIWRCHTLIIDVKISDGDQIEQTLDYFTQYREGVIIELVSKEVALNAFSEEEQNMFELAYHWVIFFLSQRRFF